MGLGSRSALMSALGQKQTYAAQKKAQKAMSALPNSDRKSGFPQQAMSALPPKADMCVAARDVRFGPIADKLSLATLSALITSSRSGAA
jgi:hypothetical protein